MVGERAGDEKMKETVVKRLWQCFQKQTQFTLKEAYKTLSDVPQESIRARIYENLGIQFDKVARGIYCVKDGAASCVVLEGNGRDLSIFADHSIDCIITDHPWLDEKSNKGGNRAFAEYNCFQYTKQDFLEKGRVLKDGCFLVEVIPEENSNNYQYLYELKQMAEEAGLQYYSKVPWKKGNFVSNTGRKAKNMQDIMIFSKGKARAMRFDKKKSAQTETECYMSGTNGMLPTCFDVEPVKKAQRIHQSELPCNLIEQIIEFLTLPGEIVLDQFAGSGVVGEVALRMNRNCILIEQVTEIIHGIQNRLERMEDVQ